MMARTWILAGALALASLGGCFETPSPPCSFICGEEAACPGGYRCAPDNFCKRDDVDPAFRCPGTPTEDASTIDSQPPADADPADAMVDAEPMM